MDFSFRRIILWVVLSFFLASCVASPSKKYSFSLVSGTPDSSWSKKSLASPAEIDFKFNLHESISNATTAKISFFGSDKTSPEVTVKMADEKCSGAYEVIGDYRTGRRELKQFYFKTRLGWDETSKIAVRWLGTNSVSITINDNETFEFEPRSSIREVVVEVSKGGLDADEVSYKNLN